MPDTAIAYIRVSTSRQDLGPKAQRDQIEAWAKREGVTVVACYEDIGVSGGAELDERPGLIAATEALRTEGAKLLVVAKRDRLARDVLVAAMIERLCERVGARVVSACGTGNGNTPEAQLLRGVVDLFAQYERAIIRARTRAALAAKKARGERVGGVPYGYRDEGGLLVEDEAEQVVVRRVRELRDYGLSLRAVGRTLLADGYQPRRAKTWHVQVVARIAGSRGPVAQPAVFSAR